MLAAVYRRYGGPEVIRIEEVPKPEPKVNEVLIQVHATTANRTDCGYLRGKPPFIRLFSGLTRPKHVVLGNEFAGRIEAVGSGVTAFRSGDRVFGYDDTTSGGHAQYKTMPEDGTLALMPDNFSYEQMAAGTEGSHYALNNIRAAGVTEGTRVMVYGATGAIGSAAVQLCKQLGAYVTGVCSTRDVELVASLGADQVIDYTRQDFTQSDQPYDFVFDAVGKSSFGRCRRLLKPGGIYCSTDLGPKNQNPFLVLWTRWIGSKKVIFPVPRPRRQDIELLRDLIAAGSFKPLIDRTYPLDQIVDAFRYVETGQKLGNVVITVPQEAGA